MIHPALSWSATEMVAQIGRGEITAENLAQRHLERIAKRCFLNTFIATTPDTALTAAEESDRADASSDKRPLRGVPIAIKDNICVAGVPCTCGSRILAGWVPPYEATAVTRLREAGAVILGKTNLDEFGMGSSTENSAIGATHNPHDPERTPGGSSGGSAAAVADCQCAVALGTDTGGSVRQPAAFCGVVGLKPTYGAVSRWGLVAYGSSLDQIGVLARTVADVRSVFAIIKGKDERDATSVVIPENRETPEHPVIGMPEEYFGEGLDPEVRQAIDNVADSLQLGGCEIRPVSLPHTRYTIATYYIIAMAEASSNLARYDGVRFGHRAAASDNLLEMYAQTRAEGFGAEVKRRILLGTHVLSAGYFDAYYGTAQRARARIAQDFAGVFSIVDCLLTPTTPTPAFRLGEKCDDPLAMYLSDVYTVSVNLAGLPAVSVPCGYSASGLPIGAQFIGRPFEEQLILDVAERIPLPESAG